MSIKTFIKSISLVIVISIRIQGSPLPQQQQQQQLDQSSDYYPAPPPPANRGYPPEPQPAYQPKSKPTENSEQGKTEPSTNQGTKSTDDMYKTLSRSKASLWVDTNQGNIFSTSLGSSHLEKKDGQVGGSSSGHSKNMMLTLLIQPEGQHPITAIPTQGQGSNLKPILLLLQRQQDVSELILEKEEKIEKMNVHLQQYVKNQHNLIVELLSQIKLFLEIIKSPGSAAHHTMTQKNLDDLKKKMLYDPKNPQLATSSSSAANAMVIPVKRSRSQEHPKGD